MIDFITPENAYIIPVSRARNDLSSPGGRAPKGPLQFTYWVPLSNK